ncbi:2-dehydropantoate 2-reductase [Bacillus sp. 03113]|uniref:2-dehydropantoate 2-reductase n=1 Tax=Bacillus sp. 03113 TaxID=2578211 RepID=UPI0015E8BADE|nr:2-dehydropantoate 2-reductase [Bacillus sp. 03113]
MKIGIIGGGAIGLLYAFNLSFQHEVCLYVRTKQQANIIASEGIFCERNGQKKQRFVKVEEFKKTVLDDDFTIVTVKQYQLEKLIPQLHQAKTILFLQNGMSHLKWLDHLLAENIFLGVSEHGSLKINDNHIIHTGIGITRVAIFKGEITPDVKRSFINSVEDFPIKIESNYYNMMIKKLVVNVMINPLTAILQIHNGELLTNPHFKTLFDALFAEVQMVLSLKHEVDLYPYVMEICKRTALNKSSMLKDVEEGRPTEVDAILGYIIKQAEERQINAPIIKSLYHLIKGKELAKRGI